MANPWDAEDDEDFPAEDEEVIEQPVSQEDDRAGEFFLREVLGATPIKSDED